MLSSPNLKLTSHGNLFHSVTFVVRVLAVLLHTTSIFGLSGLAGFGLERKSSCSCFSGGKDLLFMLTPHYCLCSKFKFKFKFELSSSCCSGGKDLLFPKSACSPLYRLCSNFKFTPQCKCKQCHIAFSINEVKSESKHKLLDE